jgi:hypothetical protein
MQHIKNDMVKIMVWGMSILFCAVITLAVVSNAIPAHVDTLGGRVSMFGAQLAGVFVGVVIGGSIGWAIDVRLVPWIERSVMSSTDPQGPRHWGMW